MDTPSYSPAAFSPNIDQEDQESCTQYVLYEWNLLHPSRPGRLFSVISFRYAVHRIEFACNHNIQHNAECQHSKSYCSPFRSNSCFRLCCFFISDKTNPCMKTPEQKRTKDQTQHETSMTFPNGSVLKTSVWNPPK